MEVLERCLALAPADEQARARAALSAMQQELEMHKDAAASRQKTGQEWQTIAGNKETEVVRLRAEVNRMRQAMSSNMEAHSSQAGDVAALQAQLREALALNKAQQRQAVVTSSAADGPSAELHRLRAELEGRSAQLQRAEADLAAQAASASARFGEMQDSFVTKIADMRRTHQQQLEQAVAAARASGASDAAGRTGPRAGAAALEQQTAQRLQRAEADAIAVRQQLEAAVATIAELQGKLSQARSEADTSRSQLSGTQFSEKALKARVKELESQAARAQREQQQQQQQQKQQAPQPLSAASAAAAPTSPPPPAPGVDLEMLTMMEGQLARLSDIIRTREAELGQMRAALQAGLEERRELLQQIEDLGAALQAAQQGGGGGGGGEGSGLGSPKSSVGAPARGLPYVSPGRPYRTGLTSKPRHFK